MIKISVIIPVYNGEPYLEQCIRSVLRQTLKELEIICVDDGSTDASVQIIRNFMARDGRILLLRQENQGAGKARNLALESAQGQYIAFLDADDFYMDGNALEQMVSLCEKMNIPACASLRKRMKNGELQCDQLFQKTEKGVVLDYRDFQIDYNYQDFIFLREHLTKNHIHFPDYRRFQDPPFLVRTLFLARKFAVADTYLYAYRVAPVSARFNHKSTCDLLHGLIDNLEFARKHQLDILFGNTVRRLEIEYKHIFFKNIPDNGLDILKLLIRANEIICEQNGEQDYVIKPLSGMLKNIYQYEKDTLEKISKENEIVLYGAGQFGQVFFDYLKRNGLSKKVAAFVVSDLKGNRLQIDGVPVMTLQDLKKRGEIRMFVTVREDFQEEITKYLNENEYKNYEFIDDDFYSMVLEE